MNNETTATGITPEMTIPDAVNIARQEAAKNTGEVRSALTMLADYAMPLIPHDEPAEAEGEKYEGEKVRSTSHLPTSTPSDEDRHMSYPEAIAILAELARKRTMSVDQVNALEMGVRRLMCRHFQRQRNWANRRAAKEAEAGTPNVESLTPEEELADTIARQKEVA